MTEKIKEALAKLDVSNDNHWTADGLPRIETLRMLVGNPALSREEVVAADSTFTRQTKIAPPPPPEPTPPPAPVLAPKEVHVPPPVEDTLEKRYEEAHAKLDVLRVAKNEVTQAYNDQAAVVDKLMTELDARKLPHHKQLTDTIQSYLESQNAARAAKGERWAEFKKTGLSLKDILPQRAPIDQIRQRKK